MGVSAAVLYSGGKDSTFTVQKLRERGFEVVCLVTVFSENPDSYMLHTSNIEMTDLASRALEIPLLVGHTKGHKEEELEDMRTAILKAKEEFHFEVLGCGGLASNYQKSRIDILAEECDLVSEAPLWGIDQISYLRTLISQKYSFIMTSVSAEGLDASWLGRIIDEKALAELELLSIKYGFNVALEGGEGETLVLDCPIYPRNRIKIVQSHVQWEKGRGILKIADAKLVSK
ncbi:MAG: diphthine--ammonia ligase [Thaumarchaeota archaeon]|nr:diphthine--ammonia ligase [Nitrososphaerota archaeon]MCL5067766.1 diphthine--ammonia ligase [Nitrososphaerota archaeon]